DFTTGEEICTLDALLVSDTDSDSPYVFTVTDESHDYVATAISYTSGSAQEISPVAGTYDWTYGSWSVGQDDDSVFSAAASGASTPEMGVVTALGEDGDAIVAISATVTTGGTDVVSGTADVTAFLCENPWPQLTSFPWTDDAAGATNFAEAGTRGFTNFSTSYCRDAGESRTEDDVPYTADDLPAVTVKHVDAPEADGVIQEYFFQMGDGSGDAIGVRVGSNSEYLSPMAWYEAQDFTGSPKEITVDGFPAIEDGRTVYVGAANDNGTAVYPNIYVISYNENASQDTIDVYDMMLDNLEFAINVDDNRFCYASGAIVTDSSGNPSDCSSDLDCTLSAAQTCGSDKLKLSRDMTRLGDLNDIALALDLYGDENGACSDTTSQSCSDDDDCPTDETCEPLVPTLPSGTFVASIASSAWSSWEDIFGGALDGSDVAADPLNAYSSCGSGTYASYDADTCVNQTTGAYVCPEDSYVYHYRSVGAESYELNATIEYAATPWYGDVDGDTTDAYDLAVDLAGAGFCDGDVYGTSTTCGDGVIGGTEQCEIGDTDSVSCGIVETYNCADLIATTCLGLDDTTSCTSRSATSCVQDSSGAFYCAALASPFSSTAYPSCSDFDATSCTDATHICALIDQGDSVGTMSATCLDDCSDYQTETEAEADGASCESFDCGNGVVEGTETCDDGNLNGRYGYCGTDCTYASGSYCGDGEVSGSEACDCGDAVLQALSDSGDIAASLTMLSARPYGGDARGCAGTNGEYGGDENTTCSWDCSGPADYCGDDEITDGELCDGNTSSWEGALCQGGTDDGEACEINSDCESEVCGDVYQCVLDAAVDCNGPTDVFNCGDWGTCEISGVEFDSEFTCALGGATTACTTDADCGGGSMECVRDEAGTQYCANVNAPTTCSSYADDASCSSWSARATCEGNVYGCGAVSARICSDSDGCSSYETCVLQEDGIQYCAAVSSSTSCDNFTDDSSCTSGSHCVALPAEAYACEVTGTVSCDGTDDTSCSDLNANLSC
ncbi:MAG: hypothetical protein NUV56_00220, partial [Candidatus Uhrbacteria bacterium]|nr:hypothetical protein [Candidatus Uhrbacteria bacterium]